MLAGAAAAGWTSHPRFPPLLGADRSLRSTSSASPTAPGPWPGITNFVSFFLFIAYMCTYYVHVAPSH
jgi:hypothetical protein